MMLLMMDKTKSQLNLFKIANQRIMVRKKQSWGNSSNQKISSKSTKTNNLQRMINLQDLHQVAVVKKSRNQAANRDLQVLAVMKKIMRKKRASMKMTVATAMKKVIPVKKYQKNNCTLSNGRNKSLLCWIKL